MLPVCACKQISHKCDASKWISVLEKGLTYSDVYGRTRSSSQIIDSRITNMLTIQWLAAIINNNRALTMCDKCAINVTAIKINTQKWVK